MSVNTLTNQNILLRTRPNVTLPQLNKTRNNKGATTATSAHNPNARKSYVQNSAARTKRGQSVSSKSAKIGLQKATTTNGSFGAMQKEFEKKTCRMAELHCRPNNPSFDKALIRNVLAFVQLLPKYRSGRIDEEVFLALFSDRFKMTNFYLNKSMFGVLVQGRIMGSRDVIENHTHTQIKSAGTISVETLTTYLCALLSDNLRAMSELVFHVFDHNWSDSIDKKDLYYILEPMFDEMNKNFPPHNEDEEEIENDKDFLIRCVVNKLDTDGDGYITKEEFCSMAREDRSVLYFFGPLLADTDVVSKFRKMLTDKTPFVIKSEFRDERRRLLKSIQTNRGFIQSLYPIELEFI